MIQQKTNKVSTENHTIEIYELIKIYKRKSVETSALRGLNCTIDKGEIVVLMGPSGCGKTTLMNIIGGISRPSAGAVIIDGEVISEFSERELEKYRLHKISYIFQQKNLIPTMTVWDNITFIVDFLGKLDKKNKTRIKEILKFIGIESKLKHFPDELSGGEQQRVALATALAKDTPIILCDEPTGELDSKAKLQVMRLLKLINKKYPDKTIIIVSHDPDFKLIADRVFYMRDGQISYEENNEKLMKLSLEEINENHLGKHKGIKKSRNATAIKELRELINTITMRLTNLEEQDQKQEKIKINEVI